MDQINGTTSGDASTQVQDGGQPVQDGGQPADAVAAPDPSGFGSRGRIRRRARFLRKARELAYRDLGGLVFNLHRFGQRNDELVLAKLNLLGQIDYELRTLQDALRERQPITVLREAGITACPRCAAIHGSEDRFCPHCGLSMGRHPDLPIAGGPAAQPPAATVAPAAPAPHDAGAIAQPARPGPRPRRARRGKRRLRTRAGSARLRARRRPPQPRRSRPWPPSPPRHPPQRHPAPPQVPPRRATRRRRCPASERLSRAAHRRHRSASRPSRSRALRRRPGSRTPLGATERPRRRRR